MGQIYADPVWIVKILKQTADQFFVGSGHVVARTTVFKDVKGDMTGSARDRCGPEGHGKLRPFFVPPLEFPVIRATTAVELKPIDR